MIAAPIVLASVLQIFNWFPVRYVTTFMAIYFLGAFSAYITPFEWDNLFYSALPAYPCFVCAGVMVGLNIIDYFTFYLHPLQVNIIVDNEKGLKSMTRINQD